MTTRLAPLLAAVPPGPETDAELLARFARRGDEAAFAALVRRHGRMVLGVCRRVLGDAHAAEDAFQAAFLVLARRAPTLPRPEALAGWLYGVARRVAAGRRRPALLPLPLPGPVDRRPDPLDMLTGRELLAVLDEEVERLPAAYRLPVALCCLDGLTLEEAAGRLGCTTGAIRGRLERGRARLRIRLAARGLAPAFALAGTGVLPPGLAATTARSASHFRTRTGPVPDVPRTLAEGTLHAMAATNFRRAAVVLFAAAAAAALLAGQLPATQPPAGEKMTPAARPVPEAPAPRPAGTTVTGRVLAAPGGAPLAGETVTLWNGNNAERRTTRADADGRYSFAGVLPGDYYKVWLEERAGVWSEAVVVQVADRPVAAADLFTELPQSLSGTVTDADTGLPVAGVGLNFSTADRNRDSARTDARGRFRLYVTPRDVDVQCYGTNDRYHPTVPDGRAWEVGDRRIAVAAGRHVAGIDFTVKSAPPFAVRVVGPDGRAAPGVDLLVRLVWQPTGVRGVECGVGATVHGKTDADGRFAGYLRRSAHRPDRVETVAVKAIARTPDRSLGGVAEAETGSAKGYKLDPVAVTLRTSAAVRLRAVDPDGRPIGGAELTASDGNADWNDVAGPVRSLGGGAYEMTGLVPGLRYHLAVSAKGFQTWEAGVYRGPLPEGLLLRPGEVRTIGNADLDWWGPKAVPAFVRQLASPDAAVRAVAAGQLAALGPDAAAAVGPLRECLTTDPANTVRFVAAEALGRIGPAAKAAVPDLIRALREDADGVPREAAVALGRLGDPAALPALRGALTHRETDAARAAAEAVRLLEKR